MSNSNICAVVLDFFGCDRATVVEDLLDCHAGSSYFGLCMLANKTCRIIDQTQKIYQIGNVNKAL